MNGAFDSATEVTVVWLWLWNFIESGEINNRFLHPNEQPLQRIFLYLVRQHRSEQSKIGHFQFSKPIFDTKYLQNYVS